MLSAEIIGSKLEIITRLLKRDWKVVKIAKEIIRALIGRIELVMTTLK